MIKIKQRFNDSPGQALVEFALIITVLLMMIFLIIESARILWAWNTVQNAAREGVRYAITGQAEAPNCPVDFGLPKFVTGDRNVCDDLRVASIIERTHSHLAGLPLNETSSIDADEEYYNIHVYGAPNTTDGVPGEALEPIADFGGYPNNYVTVQVEYRVPIITPFFRPFIPSIKVAGQETLINESFGQLGGTGDQGAALPPKLPLIPTIGPSPTPTNTPTAGPTATFTNTPTATPTPICDLQFEGSPLVGNDFVLVTGDVGIDVVVINLDGGNVLGSGTLNGPFPGDHACDGFLVLELNSPLTDDDAGDFLQAFQLDLPNNSDTALVLSLPPTLTPTPTYTPIPTSTPTNTPQPTPTNTPSVPYIYIAPNCGPGPDVSFSLQGINWPTDQSVTLSGLSRTIIVQAGHPGNFTYTWTAGGITAGTYTISAVSGSGQTSNVNFTVPCPGQPTPTPGASSTPSPADLVAISPPTLISTRPIVAYQPVEFSVVITNTGDFDVADQFFVDLYLDPSTILTDRIPLTQSDGYIAVSTVAAGDSRVITLTAPFGFTNYPTNHQVYGMVDSVLQIDEASETNNVTNPLTVTDVTPGPTPTPTVASSGDDVISGVAFIATDLQFIPQYRAFITLSDGVNTIATTTTDVNGYYEFTNVALGTYSVSGCVQIDDVSWYGILPGISPPENLAIVLMNDGVPCP